MYYTDPIRFLSAEPAGVGLRVRAWTPRPDKAVQAYVAGRLIACVVPRSDLVQLVLPSVEPSETVLLLAVDPADAQTDYWAEALAGAGARTRLQVRTPRTIAPYRMGDWWAVYLGPPDEPLAGRCVWRGPFYPDLHAAGGFGAEFGAGGLGWDGAGAPGMGLHFGRGEFGFDCEMLAWTSPPLPPDTYGVAVVVEDAAGNASPAWEGPLALPSPPRPPQNLTVQAYDPQADLLTLSFTPSPDLPA